MRMCNWVIVTLLLSMLSNGGYSVAEFEQVAIVLHYEAKFEKIFIFCDPQLTNIDWHKGQIITFLHTSALLPKNIRIHTKQFDCTGKNNELRQTNKQTLSTWNLTKNSIAHGRSKHIETKFHFLEDHVNKGKIILTYC
jgi:hypothetical protein